MDTLLFTFRLGELYYPKHTRVPGSPRHPSQCPMSDVVWMWYMSYVALISGDAGQLHHGTRLDPTTHPPKRQKKHAAIGATGTSTRPEARPGYDVASGCEQLNQRLLRPATPPTQPPSRPPAHPHDTNTRPEHHAVVKGP